MTMTNEKAIGLGTKVRTAGALKPPAAYIWNKWIEPAACAGRVAAADGVVIGFEGASQWAPVIVEHAPGTRTLYDRSELTPIPDEKAAPTTPIGRLRATICDVTGASLYVDQWEKIDVALAGGLPMSADECAEDPPIRCGTFDPEAVHAVRVARARRARHATPSMVKCGHGVLLSQPCGDCDPEPVKAPQQGDTVHGLDLGTGADGKPIRAMYTGAIRGVDGATTAFRRGVTDATMPSKVPHAPPLSLVCARDKFATVVVVSRSGDWGRIDEHPRPPSPGLWRWVGKAEAEPDEQVGGWNFEGTWTLLPVPS
jgi:hypothetical protein